MPFRPRPYRILFVGSFVQNARDGTVGGQMQACRILVETPLTDSIQWILLDTTQRSLPPPGLPVRTFDAFRRLFRFMLGVMKRPNCILLFSSFNWPGFIEKGMMGAVGRLFGFRVVWSIRSEIAAASKHDNFARFRKILLRRPTILLCQTAVAAEAIARLAGADIAQRIVVIPNWIDCSGYDPRLRPSATVTFVFLGWCEAAKGIRDLMQASRKLAAESIPFRLEIGGGGSQLEWLIQARSEMNLTDSVNIHGWVHGEKKKALLEVGDVLVLPSYSEGLPNSVLEGMAAGMAVIATPVGGIPSLVQHGENGLLVPVGDVTALANAMTTLALDPERRWAMGQRSAEKARERHDIKSLWPSISSALGCDPCS